MVFIFMSQYSLFEVLIVYLGTLVSHSHVK